MTRIELYYYTVRVAVTSLCNQSKNSFGFMAIKSPISVTHLKNTALKASLGLFAICGSKSTMRWHAKNS
jgi:hypothetical protein